MNMKAFRRRLSLMRPLALVCIMTISTSLLHGVDLAGKSFGITLMTGKDPQQANIEFTATDLTCKAFGKLPYTATPKKGSSAITFIATVTDPRGRAIVISGEVHHKEVHGSITLTPKDGPPTAINFTSVKPK
jgi:hypothetical protein